MSVTPEGKVKKRVRDLLTHPRIWQFWPVGSVFQAATLDVLCVIRVRDVPVFFMVETKRPGKGFTARQSAHARDMRERLNVKVFRVSDDADYARLRLWLLAMLALPATLLSTT
jgi:hypothetical protein